MQKFFDAVKRYSGYTRFVGPVWSAYVGWCGSHPKTVAMIIVALAIFAIR